MSIKWNYDVEKVMGVLPVGEYRIRFEEVTETKSKNGNDMLKIKFSVSGKNNYLFHNLVFMPDRPEITNSNLHAIYSSFGIKDGDLNLQNWIGKVGACKIKHEEYNGEMQAKINYFVDKSRQDKLPDWVEGGKKQSKPTTQATSNNNVDDSGIPF